MIFSSISTSPQIRMPPLKPLVYKGSPGCTGFKRVAENPSSFPSANVLKSIDPTFHSVHIFPAIHVYAFTKTNAPFRQNKPPTDLRYASSGLGNGSSRRFIALLGLNDATTGLGNPKFSIKRRIGGARSRNLSYRHRKVTIKRDRLS